MSYNTPLFIYLSQMNSLISLSMLTVTCIFKNRTKANKLICQQ